MKKFLLNVSKRNIPRLFIVFLVILLMILFSSAKTVYAASNNNGGLFSNDDFRINNIYSEDSDIFISIDALKRSSQGQVYHNNFNVITGYTNGNTFGSYELELVNSGENGYIYNSKEIYKINNLFVTDNLNFRIKELKSLVPLEIIDLSSYSITFSTLLHGFKTLKTAKAYGYIHTERYKKINNIFSWRNYYKSYITFCLYVDGVGMIDESAINSLRFGFKDSNDNWVYIDSNFDNNDNFWEYKEFTTTLGQGSEGRTLYYMRDPYNYVCSSPSRNDGIRNGFKSYFYSSSELWGEPIAKADENGVFDDFPFEFKEHIYVEPTEDDGGLDYIKYGFNYMVFLDDCPNLSSGVMTSSDDVKSFGIVEFSYWDEDKSLIAASLFDDQNIDGSEKPVYIVQDENGNWTVITIDDNGNIVPAIGYSVDEYGNLYDPNGKFVGFGKRNFFKSDKDPDISNFDIFINNIKKWLSIILGIIGFIVVLRIIRLLSNLFGKKDNNVNIHVKTGSNKSRRRRNR